MPPVHALPNHAIAGGLYAIACAAYIAASSLVRFPANEGSAYYLAVAKNLATGRGAVLDAIWSYATPPLVLPRPAFELWQPLASVIAAVPMGVLGASIGAGQIAMALVAALLAPLAWRLTVEAGQLLKLNSRHALILGVGAGLVTVLMGPFVLAVALPDSTMPFAVMTAIAALLLASSLRAQPRLRAWLWFGLGLTIGFAWLARHEAIWVALAVVAWAAGAGFLTARMVAAAIVGGLLVSVPWLARNLLVFGTPLPGQAAENALIVSNEQIFAYLDRPTLSEFGSQGASGVIGNILLAFSHNLVNVLIVPAAPVTVLGLCGAAWLFWRHPLARQGSLGALAAFGLLIFAVNTMVFPVATLWGTFQHAAGPAFLALVVGAVVGLDAALRAVGRRRRWQHGNAWLAPLALALMLAPLTWLQVSGMASESDRRGEQVEAVAQLVLAQPEAASDEIVVVTDRPIWLSEATGISAISLPAETLASLETLVAEFSATLLVVFDRRGEYPDLLRTEDGQRCFREREFGPPEATAAAVFSVADECR
jgi:hypothetical protein